MLNKGWKQTGDHGFVVEQEECVYPMVPAGAPIKKMLLVITGYNPKFLRDKRISK
jgi:hypothetical protein